jgi:hypothetical protein
VYSAPDVSFEPLLVTAFILAPVKFPKVTSNGAVFRQSTDGTKTDGLRTRQTTRVPDAVDPVAPLAGSEILKHH